MSRGHDIFRVVAVIAVISCYTTILLGGNVMASDSGLACPQWPSCNGSFLPPLAGGTGIEWAHRVSAFTLASIVAILTALGIVFERSRPMVLRLTGASLSLVVLEALLGGVVVESNLTVPVVLLHLAIATVLFGLLLLTALVANLKEIPRRWVEWARRAAEEAPSAPAAPHGIPARSPAPVATAVGGE